jgi:UDP-glucose 4-epimerase
VKIVVTGGAGFIGANLCRHLVSSQHEVIALDDLSTGSVANLEGIPVKFIVGSFLDEPLLRATVSGADVIVHLGALPSVPRSIADPGASHEANATGTLRILDAARGLDDPLVVVASSSSVYGANPQLPKHESMTPLPMSPYAVSKLAAEQYTLAWQDSFGLRTLALRFFNVFGPLQAAGHAYAAVVPAFVSAALRNEPVLVHGDGQQTRDFTYVGTVCKVLADAVERGVTSRTPVNLAFGNRTSLLDMLALVEVIIGHPVERQHVEPRAGDVRHSQADNVTLRELFPHVEPVDLREGIDATVRWMRTVLRI